MAINLCKYRDSMLAAWREVVDDKSATNWALFGYEGQTNDLKLISKGDGGIEEMTEDLNSGSIMYAFCQVQDPKTSLPKCVLINWQGEGAPVVRKGMCANHVRAVTDFFKGVHVTLNARTEEDVDSKLVIDKVAKSTGSAYSFKERSNLSSSNNSGPVGTTYKRVNAGQEINSKERDRFWEREEQEERKRQEEERKRRDEERKRLVEERRQREVAEAANREKRDAQVHAIQSAARTAEQKVERARAEEPGTDNELAEREREERERRERSEVLRRQRSEEAQSLIAKRTINARAVFEQNTAVGQLSQRGRRSSYQAGTDSTTGKNSVSSPEAVSPSQELGRKTSLPTWPPVHTSSPSVPIEIQAMKQAVVQSVQPDQLPAPIDVNQQEVPEPAFQADSDIHEPTEEDTPPSEEEQNWESEDSQTGTIVRKSHKKGILENSSSQPTQHPVVPDVVYTNGGAPLLDEDDDGDLGLRAHALYDYQAADNTEISFDPGDIITHIEQIDEGWWQGLSPDGTFGLFPANYVELLD